MDCNLSNLASYIKPTKSLKSITSSKKGLGYAVEERLFLFLSARIQKRHSMEHTRYLPSSRIEASSRYNSSSV